MKTSILSAAVCGALVLSGAEGTSRDYQMRQRALVENAMAFFLKGAAMQYDSVCRSTDFFPSQFRMKSAG